jgi:putative copper resistance protein D
MNGPLVIARAVHFAATLLLTGGLAFRCFVAAPVLHDKAGAAVDVFLRRRLAWIIWAALAAAFVSGAAWLVLLSGEMGGVPVAQAFSEGLPWRVLTQTTFGDAWTLRAGMAAVLAMLLAAHDLAAPRLQGGLVPVLDIACVMLAAAFAASIAWTGHAAGMEGIDGTIHLASDALHLVAAGAWLGALWPLALLLAAASRAGDPGSAAVAWQATRRFSVLGMVSVGVLLATGIVNTWEILGLAALSLGTDYNLLLLVKVVLFAAMVAIAAFNRQRLTPRLSGADHRCAVWQLQWNSLTEIALGLLVLAIVAILGRMTPHMDHMHMHG